MYCSQCGKEIPDNSKFCNECGCSVCQVETSFDADIFDADVFDAVYNEKTHKETKKTRKPLGCIVNAMLSVSALVFASGAIVCIGSFFDVDNQYNWSLLAVATFWFVMLIVSLYSLIHHKCLKKIVLVLCVLWCMTLMVSAIIGLTDTDYADRGKSVSEQYEEQFIGKWATSSGGNTIIYSFYEEDGEYKAGCVTSGYNVYEFDKYTATGKTITLYQDGKTIKYYYSFEDGYLYMDGLEFEPFD